MPQMTHFEKLLFCSGGTFNKFVNVDLKNLVNWLNANKISLTGKKLKWSYLNLKQKSLIIQ